MNIGDIFDGYNLIESLGDGSYGDVYLSEKDGEKFALKFLRNKNDGVGFDKSKFDAEKNSWIKVSGHRNIIKIHRADIKKARYFIVMDFADGGSLQRKKFPRNEAVQIMLEILGGVNHLHNLNIIHRDIKPANILLKTNIPCLGDFGLARDLDLTLSSTQIAGTFGYLSPEIINADQTYQRHPSNDLWATAVTFYEILTGTRPFEGSILNLVSFNQKPYPSDFPADLTEFFDKAFQKERENRFQSATEMITTLQEIEQKRVEQELSEGIRKQLETEYHQKYQDAIKKNDDEINLLRKMNKTLEEQAQKERDNFQNKIKTRDAELTDLKDTILALSSHHKIEEEKQNLTNKFEKKISSLEEKLQNLKDNNYKLESQAKVGGEEIYKAKNIIKGLEAGMTEKKKELSGFIDNNAELKSQILNKNKEIEEFTQSYKQEKEQLQKSKKIIKELEIDINKKEKEFSDLSEKNTKLTSQISNKNSEIEKNKQLYKQEKQQHLALKAKQPSKFFSRFGGLSLLSLILAGFYWGFSLLPLNYSRIAQECLEKKDFQCAIINYNEAIKKYPNDASYYANLGDIYENPNYDAKDLNKFIEYYDKAISINVNYEKKYLETAENYLNVKDFENSSKLFEHFIEKNQNNSLVYKKLGDIYGDLKNPKKDFKKAIEFYDKAITLLQTFSDAYVSKADIYRYKIDEKNKDKNKENQNKAIELYTKVINELDKNNSTALFGLAWSNDNLENYDKAIEYYERYCNGEKNCYANLNIAIIYQYGIKDFDKAREYYENISDSHYVKSERLAWFYSNEDSKNKYTNKILAENHYQTFLTKEKEYKEDGKDFEKTKKDLKNRIDNMETEASVNSNTNTNTNSFKPNFNLSIPNINRRLILNNSNLSNKSSNTK